jgi:hypothetical protein
MPGADTEHTRDTSRIAVALPVRLEFDEADGAHRVVEATTENIGRYGVLVHVGDPKYLPQVRTKVRFTIGDIYGIEGVEDNKITVETEVLRVERDPGNPQAAFTILDGNLREWGKAFTFAQQEAAAVLQRCREEFEQAEF